MAIKSSKKVGGQEGHKGSKLTKSNHPTKIILHDVTECSCCKTTLRDVKGEIKSRQIFDIPKIEIEVTEHRIVAKRCTNCGKKNKTAFPKGLVQEAQYGNNIKAFSTYLQNYQMLPYARTSELIYDLTNHKISVGSLANFQKDLHAKLEVFERKTIDQLLQSGVLHADETGIRQHGNSHWMHVLSNQVLSFFGYHSKRGKEAINAFNIIPLYKGNLVHDRFSTYFSYSCQHSLCNAHILRELLYFWETTQNKWTKDLMNLFKNLNHRKKNGYKFSLENYENILKRFETIIKPTIEKYDKVYTKTKEERLAFALEKHKHLFLKFVKVEEVPFDNNQAERDLRMIKVKQKISGCFREPDYATYFARVRSYISTLKKNEQDILLNIQNAFIKKHFFPVLAE